MFMLRKVGAAIYRGFFWTYERGTWQYDIMVALILAFIFLTPRPWFNDQPQDPASSDVVLLSAGAHEKVYQLRADLIEPGGNSDAEEVVRQGVARVLQTYTGRTVQITHIKPETDSSGQVVSYAVSVQE